MRLSNKRRGFTLIELLIVVAIILIIAAIALPRLAVARQNAQEMAAVRTISTLHTAQTQYYSQFGKYATTLQELGPPASGTAGPSASDLIPKELSEGKKGGYIYEMKTAPTGYTINANPEAFGTSGRRTFYSDQSLTIRENWKNEPSTVNSPELK